MPDMTMREALELAQQYGHVPLRISGPPINMAGGGPDNPLESVTGVWGVPDGRGGIIPLDQLPALTPPAQAWSGGQPSMSQQGPSQPYIAPSGPIGSTINAWNRQAPSMAGSPVGAIGRSAGLDTTLPPYQMPASQPSTSGPIVPTYTEPPGGYVNGMAMPPVQARRQAQQPVININVGSGQPPPQFERAPSMFNMNTWPPPGAGNNTPPSSFMQGLPGPTQGPQPYSPQLGSAWSNAGPPGFAGNAMWQGRRGIGQMMGWR